MAFVASTTLRLPSRMRRIARPGSQQPCATARSPVSPPTGFDIAKFSSILYSAQHTLCAKLEAVDQLATFSTDPWQSQNGSGGTTRVLQQGAVFEKAGVNVSVVRGVLSESRAAAMRSRGRHCLPGTPYHAAALSFVCHAKSPFVPTLRGDVRVFSNAEQVWAGGGVDLTVFYVNRTQIAAFHRHWKRVCDAFDPSFYPQFKRQCDNYFFLPSRGEYRGVGGLFYDDVVLPEQQLLAFQSAMLSEFLPSFTPILEENTRLPWTEEQKRWQRIRRGRYLEFNLLEDRGVRFGLAGAKPSRTDAIMISAPPSIEWPYGHVPLPGSAEEETLALLRGTPVEWADL